MEEVLVQTVIQLHIIQHLRNKLLMHKQFLLLNQTYYLNLAPIQIEKLLNIIFQQYNKNYDQNYIKNIIRYQVHQMDNQIEEKYYFFFL